MGIRAWGRDVVRAALAVLPALFLAGAAVSLRLHLRIARHGGGFATLEVFGQGLEVALWFGMFVLPAAVLVIGLSWRWAPRGPRRLGIAFATFAIALASFQLVFWTIDGLAILYLAAGALASAVVAGKPQRPVRQVIPAAAGPSSAGPTDSPAPPRLGPSRA